MIVIVKSAPDTPEGLRGVKLAQSLNADIVLMQNGVYFLQLPKLEELGFWNTAYVLEDDRKLRGLTTSRVTKEKIKDITYAGLIDLLAETDKVVGMF